jgi:hypothetical protein
LPYLCTAMHLLFAPKLQLAYHESEGMVIKLFFFFSLTDTEHESDCYVDSDITITYLFPERFVLARTQIRTLTDPKYTMDNTKIYGPWNPMTEHRRN